MSAKEDLLRLAEKVEETGRANWVRGFRDNLAFEIRTIANAMPAEGGEAVGFLSDWAYQQLIHNGYVLTHIFKTDRNVVWGGGKKAHPLYTHPPAAPANAGVVDEGCTPTDARMLRHANHGLAEENFRLQEALQFYADRNHFVISDTEEWDTVTGEPHNLWCDNAGTATVEDGSIARSALQAALSGRTGEAGSA